MCRCGRRAAIAAALSGTAWAVMGANRPQKITLGEMREAGVRHGTGDPAPAFLALYVESGVPYYSNWCSPRLSPVASTGIAKYLAPPTGGFPLGSLPTRRRAAHDR